MLLPRGNPKRLGQLKKLFQSLREKETLALTHQQYRAWGNSLMGHTMQTPGITRGTMQDFYHSTRPGRNTLTNLYMRHRYRPRFSRDVMDINRMSGADAAGPLMEDTINRSLDKYLHAYMDRLHRKRDLTTNIRLKTKLTDRINTARRNFNI